MPAVPTAASVAEMLAFAEPSKLAVPETSPESVMFFAVASLVALAAVVALDAVFALAACVASFTVVPSSSNMSVIALP